MLNNKKQQEENIISQENASPVCYNNLPELRLDYQEEPREVLEKQVNHDNQMEQSGKEKTS